MTRFIQHYKLYQMIPMKADSILPDEGFDPIPINLIENGEHAPFKVYCKPKPAHGVRWGHRVMVMCECGKDIPFGRMGQHYKSGACVP